jgi:multisubunit Na+/H+ antiporter MnhF subunit
MHIMTALAASNATTLSAVVGPLIKRNNPIINAIPNNIKVYDTDAYLDSIMLIAIISFVSSVSISRFIGGGRVFNGTSNKSRNRYRAYK